MGDVHKCARCKKRIKPGRENFYKGEVYGDECVKKVVESEMLQASMKKVKDAD